MVSLSAGGSPADQCGASTLLLMERTEPSAKAALMPAGEMLCDFRQWTLSTGGANSGLSMHRHIHGAVPVHAVGTGPPLFTNPLRGQYPLTYSDAGLSPLAHWASPGNW